MIDTLLKELLTTLTGTVIPVVIGIESGNILSHKMTLKHLSTYDGKMISKISPIVKPATYKDRQESNLKIEEMKNDLLNEIVTVLKEKLTPRNLQTLYNNLKTVDIEKKPLLLVLGLGGTYNGSTNKLSYGRDSSFGHELIHLASTIYDKENNMILSGFRQTKGRADIGVGINEGYTELLAIRFFNKQSKSYIAQVRTMKLLEFLFEDPKELENLYFNSNLPGLVRYLEKYAPKEEIIDFILDIDKIYNYYHEFSSIPTATSTKIQLKIFQWFNSKNKDPEKLKNFTDLLYQDKFIKLITSNKKYVLNTETAKKENNHTVK